MCTRRNTVINSMKYIYTFLQNSVYFIYKKIISGFTENSKIIGLHYTHLGIFHVTGCNSCQQCLVKTLVVLTLKYTYITAT